VTDVANTMTDQQMQDRGLQILKTFDEYAEGDPFGWDWPTMTMIFPELVAEFREIQAEAKRRVAAGTWTLG